MKKLMIALASVACAAGVQAAAFDWSASGDSKDWAGAYVGDTATMTAYLYLGSVTATDSAFNFGTAVQLASSGQGGASQAFAFGSFGEKISSDKLSSDAAGQAYTIILAETAGGDLANYSGHYALLTGESKHGTDPTPEAEITSWAMFLDGTKLAQGDWKTMEAVPEPTSGLLLLLGLGVMALRRKRA